MAELLTSNLQLTDHEQQRLYHFCEKDREMYTLLRRLVAYGVRADPPTHDETRAKGRVACDCVMDGNGWMRPCPDRPDDRYCLLQHQPCEHCPEETRVERFERLAQKTNGDVP